MHRLHHCFTYELNEELGMSFIDIAALGDLKIHFQECQPRLLVVTDGSLNSGTSGFGLSRFIAVMESTIIHGMAPQVTARMRHSADVQESAFSDLDVSNFDVVFLFGWNGPEDPLSSEAREKIVAFMQAGGGVFATGDHATMGAGMNSTIPRVRSMRFWAAGDTPEAATAKRLTTNLPANATFEFDDQSDALPQRLYANFVIAQDQLIMQKGLIPSNVRLPHPLVRMPNGSALDVYPDHPHEGECRIPSDVGTTFDFRGATVSEWPGSNSFGFFPFPRLVASAMSFGNGFPGKQAVVPRAFFALVAYNGQPKGVGRVVTDATWHHYVNVNLDGMVVGGVPTADLVKIQQFYSNMARWLMPARARWCLLPWVIVKLLQENRIAEEIRIPTEGPVPHGDLRAIGSLIGDALAGFSGLADDTLNDVIRELFDEGAVLENAKPGGSFSETIEPIATDAASVVLGAFTVQVIRAAAAGDLKHGGIEREATIRDARGQVMASFLDERRAQIDHEMRCLEVLASAARADGR
jgi:hypothetical protein